ncbi:hypothetical protein [Streptomyces sp. LN500]|uniref:hypothetical protein n=1 Tax=Streptomyces sp. LN500 TaxID=3112978 RepID=UPI003720FA0E
MTDQPTTPDTCCVCDGSPVVYRNYQEQPFCAHCANCACGTVPCTRPAPDSPRERYAAAMWAKAERTIIAEWICCEPLDPKHDLCAQGYAALRMTKALIVDNPESATSDSLVDAVLAVRDREMEHLKLLVAASSEPGQAVRMAAQYADRAIENGQRAERAEADRNRVQEAACRTAENLRHAEGRAEQAEERAAAMERAMESTAADALKHRGCHRDLMGQCLRAERAEAAIERVRKHATAWTTGTDPIARAMGEDIIDALDQPTTTEAGK